MCCESRLLYSNGIRMRMRPISDHVSIYHRRPESCGNSFWITGRSKRPHHPNSGARSDNYMCSSSSYHRPAPAHGPDRSHDHRPTLTKDRYRRRCRELTATTMMYSASYCDPGVTERVGAYGEFWLIIFRGSRTTKRASRSASCTQKKIEGGACRAFSVIQRRKILAELSLYSNLAHLAGSCRQGLQLFWSSFRSIFGFLDARSMQKLILGAV